MGMTIVAIKVMNRFASSECLVVSAKRPNSPANLVVSVFQLVSIATLRMTAKMERTKLAVPSRPLLSHHKTA
jgi:hypothetical protein